MSESLISRNYYFNRILMGLGIGFLTITPFGIFYYLKKLIRNHKKKSQNDNSNQNKNFPIQSYKEENSNIISNNSNSKPPLDEKKVGKLLTRICEHILNVLAVSCDIIKQDYILDEKRFKSLGSNMKEFTLEAFKLGCKFLLHIKIF